ncbi:hypothetical protein Nstercoris_01751 [Nitrosomonas stercoris]|uniref:Uncharacterized protein n=1 Tax=Nitrosomonas stercoris TaxID=1444684 RepID=A0A4Y1YRB6_9PROT|nr:hypothetical protein Nstercoris_01751 [Nitrosomonas stercoris]
MGIVIRFLEKASRDDQFDVTGKNWSSQVAWLVDDMRDQLD